MIRRLEPTDLEVVLAINQENRPAVGDLDAERLRALVDWCEHALVVVEDGAVVAFLLVLGPRQPYASMNYRWLEERFDDHAYVDRIAVAASHQGRGLGSRLYEELSTRAAGKPVTCEVNIRPMNAGSLRFHERHGFEVIGEQDTEGGKKRVALMARR